MYLSLKKIKFSSKFYLIIFIFIYLLVNFYKTNLVFAEEQQDLILKKSNYSEMIDIKILDKYSETENEMKEIIESFKKIKHRIRIIQKRTQQNIYKLMFLSKKINILEKNNKNLEDENKKLREKIDCLNK
ncbi:hypothetical protein [Candidatus Phytoplasma tritici]|uniref:hypothetical protein n=1 Tax=Candidatus Phytoplasma tritici TaxID=321961 RepID=UPI00040E1937|nr:hypothetical protein [Candidatus Phytoplasma tritici]